MLNTKQYYYSILLHQKDGKHGTCWQSLILSILLKINVILNTEEPLKSSYAGIKKYCFIGQIDTKITSNIFSYFSFSSH